MKHCVKRKAEQSTTNWGGGSTTELFIYPPLSEYKNRDFEVRVSSATVEQSPSQFTVLEGYHRLLMPLSADLTLDFNGHRQEPLKPFESIFFEGGWETTSCGVCTDIGIMFRDNWRASLTAIESGRYMLAEGFTCLYSLSDNAEIVARTGLESNTFKLNKGDFLVLETSAKDTLEVSANDKIILAEARRK